MRTKYTIETFVPGTTANEIKLAKHLYRKDVKNGVCLPEPSVTLELMPINGKIRVRVICNDTFRTLTSFLFHPIN